MRAQHRQCLLEIGVYVDFWSKSWRKAVVALFPSYMFLVPSRGVYNSDFTQETEVKGADLTNLTFWSSFTQL